MQVLVSLPPVEEINRAKGEFEEVLFRKICGVPLLERVILTALRNGGTRVVLLHPKALSKSWLSSKLKSSLVPSSRIEMISLEAAFDPESPSDWLAVDDRLEPRFLWLPWNYVADRKTLSRIIEAGTKSSEGVRLSSDGGAQLPVVIVKEKLRKIAGVQREGLERSGVLQEYVSDEGLETISIDNFTGIAVSSEESAHQAERELVRRSGKDSDGINSKVNRWMVRPAVRWLSKTPITPNAVTFAGLAAAIFSGYWFAHGFRTAYLVGAFLYFGSVLFDEMDGMLARVTFRESPFGCWLETFVDDAGYLSIFTGMAVGLYAEYGIHSVIEGALLMFGTLMCMAILIRQRKMGTDPARPQDYRMLLHRNLKATSRNFSSLLGRIFEPLMRNGAFCYFVLLFSALNWVHAFFLSLTIGANIVWVVILSYNRFFRRPAVGLHQTYPIAVAK
jgi:phosphatidylglycerophosphate synthase